MTADTMNEMILGFSVILGVLAAYILTLVIRMRRGRSINERSDQDHHES